MFQIFFFKLQTTIGIVVSLFIVFNTLKFFCLVKFSNGSYSCYASSNNVVPGSYFYVLDYNSTAFFKSNSLVFCYFYFLQLFFITNNLNLNNKNKASVSSAPGCYSQVIQINYEQENICFILPSGSKKLFKITGLCSIGRACGNLKKRIIAGKAGISYNNGYRPSVRGNAMNPVDHPQGGRTKSKVPEKSP